MKRTIASQLKSLNIKKTKTYDIGNPGPALEQAQKCGSRLMGLHQLLSPSS